MTQRSKGWITGIATASLVFLSLASVLTGVISLEKLSHAEIWQLIVISRLPRTLAIILTGTSMAVAGMVMQIILHNRFVEASMVGTSQGAMLGLIGVTLLAPHWSIIAKMSTASLVAFLAMMVFLLISRRIQGTLQQHDGFLLPLVGIIYGGILTAIGVFFAYQYDMMQLFEIWTTGDFSGVLKGRYELLWIGGGATLILYFFADLLTIVGMGKQITTTLGISYQRLVVLTMLTVSMVTALVMVSVGMIAFIGLVVPNVVRQILGDNLRRSLPWVAWFGAVLLLLCDIVSRLVRFPYEIPVGIVFGVLGTGLFLWLLLKPVARDA